MLVWWNVLYVHRPSIENEEDVKKEEDQTEEEKAQQCKKEPLSLEELLAKKQAEEAARSKVSAVRIQGYSCTITFLFIN